MNSLPINRRPPLAPDVVVPAIQACAGRPAGEPHLIAVIRRGPHGRATATVTIASPARSGSVHFNDSSTLSFESRTEARVFVSAWIWYRVARRKAQPRGKP